MAKLKKQLRKFQMAIRFALVVFVIMMATMFLMFVGAFVLSRFGIGSPDPTTVPLFLFGIVSVIVGTIIALIFSRGPLAPLREIISATDRLAEGDFEARIDLQGPDELQKLNSSFNHMAEELGNLELLRSDFVNNFSHEFKTPIVSIRGFAKLLKHDDLSREDQNEYLDIIIDESERLAELATNVLNLSKIENQTIVADKTCYNGSEQIRRTIVVLQNKWAEKNIEIGFDCEEIEFYGNSELLGQVWLNIIDNAIKFSPSNSTIEIEIRKIPTKVIVTITDQGIEMSAETASHIFDKFYQGDASHSVKGNGIGLTLTKRIVELHGGQVIPMNRGTGTAFEVILPIKK